MLGTLAQPIVLTSAQPEPPPRDRGSVFGSFSEPDELTPKLEHTVIEYGGSGDGCGPDGGRTFAASWTAAQVIDSKFRHSAGHANSGVRDCNLPNSCTNSNSFEWLADTPLECGGAAVSTPCPE